MGFISRKIFPACGSMCVCCPAMRSRSRQPVKRYKKLLADIFPKSPDGSPSDRKIGKLCEYAAKNPFRIPKIVKYLEERCYKELRSEHIKFINIVVEAYNKLLCMCKEQMVYFAVSLLTVVSELLDNGKQDALQILGCQTLTKFIYSQSDSTYAHNIEKFVHKVCMLAQMSGEGHQQCALRASSLQCLSAMVWFMVEFSSIFEGFDEIVQATLDNYEPDMCNEEEDERGGSLHNWVDEVVRSEGRTAGESSPNCIILRPRPVIKDPSLLTKEELDTPKVWAQICIQRMADLAKESITAMRRVMDPMLAYFDSGHHWVPRDGLSSLVLSDMSYKLETSGNQQLILASVIRHLDHKNIFHDLQLKSCVIRVATALARQIGISSALTEIGSVSDLCRHLRKSLQVTVEAVGEEELNLNYSLQNAIEDCLVEIAKGVCDAQPLFDLMAITLEKMPTAGAVARATMGSSMILAHMIALVSVSSPHRQVFPEALLVQLLHVMLHPDVEVRVRGHQILSILLVPNSSCPRHEVSSVRANCPYESRRWESSTASALASITARLEKLRREKNGATPEKQGHAVQDDFKGMDVSNEEGKQGFARKNSPNFCKISIMEKAAGSAGLSDEPYILKFSEDQIGQLLSALWIQANVPDNLPSNFEAIAHSFVLTLLSSRLTNPCKNLVIRFFHLPLSLRIISLDANNGMLFPACRRSIFTLATSMLMFAAKIYQIHDLIDLLKSVDPSNMDPYLGISKDLHLFVRPQADVREYGSALDNQKASSLLLHLRSQTCESDKVLLNILIQSLSNITEVDGEDLAKQLSEAYKPEDTFVFGPQLILDLDNNQIVVHSKKSLSFDEEFSTNSSVDDDTMSEASVAMSRMPSTPSFSDVISIGKLLETALEVAGQVAGTTVSTSPLPYNTMASQCEALGTGPRRKLSNWLAHENNRARSAADHFFPATDGRAAIKKITSNDAFLQGDIMPKDQCLTMKLPPASPFDNFLRAAGC
ncbi:protein SEMI-ROLLED LEAF 2 isoform X2 [Syzygium oleosum]|uniref:protein SEMI-ROLLED LEAF 2 isoform X2 n=1 Tax=Syzygium oleosum TaxID=219896 RepID=UPI0024BA8087|nr:protein SEMI-ROLLED LEAF 2 isoform X2 [Syzygium oleosum]